MLIVREAYLKRERERKRAMYMPTVLLADDARAERRRDNREKSERFRAREKARSS